MRVNRMNLVQALESVMPGLTPKDTTEQSSSFVFKDNEVVTYNGEICCRRPFELDFECAVQGTPLLSILTKLTEDEIEVYIENNDFVVKGKRRRAGILMDEEIIMPLDQIEEADEWKDLPEEFSEAIGLVEKCAASDKESSFAITCVNIHPEWVEAHDNYHLARYVLETGFTEPVLVRCSAIRNVVAMDVTEFSETGSWVHFRNPSGLTFSCARFLEDFPDLAPYLTIDGAIKTKFPKGLDAACLKAQVFSAENDVDDQVEVVIKAQKIRLRGEGASGWYTETKTLDGYDGPSLTFLIKPDLLIALTKEKDHQKFEVTEQKLRIKRGKFVYVTSLGQTEDTEE